MAIRILGGNVGGRISSTPGSGGRPVAESKPPAPRPISPPVPPSNPDKDITMAIATLGFHVLDIVKDRGFIIATCRVDQDNETLFKRIAEILQTADWVEIGKKYMVSNGKLKYAWYVRIPESLEKQMILLSQNVRQKIPAVVRKVRLPIRGSRILPQAFIARRGRDLPDKDGAGAGVVPVKMSRT